MSKETRGLDIALTGDSIITRRILSSHDENTDALVELIRSADVAFTNLEVLPNDFQGHPAARSDGSHFGAHSWVLDELIDMGFNLFSFANNHALDYGVEGLLTSIRNFQQRQISYAGAGRNLAEARMPVYVDVNGTSVALLACTSTFFEEQSAGEQRPDVQGRPGVNPLRFDTVYEVTREQLAALERIAEDLGLKKQFREFVQLGFASEPKDPRILHLVDTNLRVAGTLNAKFCAAERPAVRTTPNAQDLADIVTWVREAKARADVVIVSLHAHEQGNTREQPAEFIREFAHHIIDAGADVLVGHGPHLLRGMEIYLGKPIFYSLGNFIGQNDLVYKLPADSYRRFNVDPALTPSEVYRIRSQNGTKGFPGDSLYWQTVMPICHFTRGGELCSVDIVPVGLTRGARAHLRGRPYLAHGEQAEQIMHKFSDLSAEFGTGFQVMDGKLTVELKHIL
ncbi:CapA family protein [Alicyclobacillus macrosporangiidus]|uniref:CapA family protein n=1 Tax=Alicyclobacillus macrosporangiidus TaxID=392015 RepID=UPI0005563BCF|nr:CapA family protein [Alicyclobacillus macrosporangiidus]